MGEQIALDSAALLAAATSDEKSKVRIEAIKALEKFSHDATRKALRKVIKDDKSYSAVAQALRTLAKVDRKNAATELYAALPARSHRGEMLRGGVRHREVA